MSLFVTNNIICYFLYILVILIMSGFNDNLLSVLTLILEYLIGSASIAPNHLLLSLFLILLLHTSSNLLLALILILILAVILAVMLRMVFLHSLLQHSIQLLSQLVDLLH